MRCIIILQRAYVLKIQFFKLTLHIWLLILHIWLHMITWITYMIGYDYIDYIYAYIWLLILDSNFMVTNH